MTIELWHGGITPHTPKTLLACLSGQLVREWHVTFERAAARHVEICSQLHGEVFISIVHYNGDINVPDHMPPSGFRVGAPQGHYFVPCEVQQYSTLCPRCQSSEMWGQCGL